MGVLLVLIRILMLSAVVLGARLPADAEEEEEEEEEAEEEEADDDDDDDGEEEDASPAAVSKEPRSFCQFCFLSSRACSQILKSQRPCIKRQSPCKRGLLLLRLLLQSVAVYLHCIKSPWRLGFRV
jgi:hypothetical protein